MTYGILSTYPPTQCGLATFTKALVESLRAPADVIDIVSVVDVADRILPGEVAHQWVRGSIGGATETAAVLDRYDVAIIQHEYGIFGGRDGADVLDVVRAMSVPSIVVLHTVLVTPTLRQREIVEELARNAVTVVTMTRTARTRLIEHYRVDPTKIRVIPHGAVANQPDDRGRPDGEAPMILTWGLLGDGKGIEWAIDAMALLGDLRPAPRYCVVGQTHPRVLETYGERYRDSLVRRAEDRGVANSIRFDARYLDRRELQRLIQQADVVLLPYDSREQVTSGVLIEAIAAGKPVVSTGFPHARELLAGGSGIVVARQDAVGIAAALRRVLTEPGLAESMSAESLRIAPDLLWPAVAARYREVAIGATRPDTVLASA